METKKHQAHIRTRKPPMMTCVDGKGSNKTFYPNVGLYAVALTLRRLQSVQNAAARLVTGARRSRGVYAI